MADSDHMTTAECWSLLEARSFGRLAVDGRDGMPNVFPVNYAVHDGSIYIRSASGSKVTALAAHPAAAFEIDGEDDEFRWSVVLRGAARRLETDKEIRESGVRVLPTDTPTQKYNFICVTPRSISGRRFAKRPNAPSAGPDASGRTPSTDSQDTVAPAEAGHGEQTHSRAERPVTIAHVSPQEDPPE